MFGWRLGFGCGVVLRGLCSKCLWCYLDRNCKNSLLYNGLFGKRMNAFYPVRQFHQFFPVYNQKYDYFLVLDFEATCEEGRQIFPQEIIEFPVIKINGRTMKCEGVFHKYIRPNRKPSVFCTQLTGITEDLLYNQVCFKQTLIDFENWLVREGLINKKIMFVTCGNWDLQVMLPDQCSQVNYPVPAVMKSWINIKKPFCAATGIFPRNLLHMLEILGLPHVGRLHSGIDDTLNTCAILEALARRGVVFHRTNFYIPPT